MPELCLAQVSDSRGGQLIVICVVLVTIRKVTDITGMEII